MSCTPSQDTAVFLRLHRALWRALWRAGPPAIVATVGVHLGNVSRLADRSGELFAPLAPADRTPGERVAVAVDHINRRFGPGTVTWGITAPHPGFFERG